MKLLGITIDRDGSFNSHVSNISRRMRARTWALSKLKKKGLSETDLIKTYKSLIRPAAEYASPAWHSLLTATQANEIERQQVQALKNIYGPEISANKMREMADIELLSKRREKMAKKFAMKSLSNPRTASWFTERPEPRYARRRSINYPKYKEKTARTDRFRNSPKNFLIRKLNE